MVLIGARWLSFRSSQQPRQPGGGAPAHDLRELEDNGTAFSAARRLGYGDLDELYAAVGQGELSAPGFLAHLGITIAQP